MGATCRRWQPVSGLAATSSQPLISSEAVLRVLGAGHRLQFVWNEALLHATDVKLYSMTQPIPRPKPFMPANRARSRLVPFALIGVVSVIYSVRRCCFNPATLKPTTVGVAASVSFIPAELVTGMLNWRPHTLVQLARSTISWRHVGATCLLGRCMMLWQSYLRAGPARFHRSRIARAATAGGHLNASIS
jgi:hypothetical protein